MNKWVCCSDQGVVKYVFSLADDKMVPENNAGDVFARVPVEAVDTELLKMYLDLETRELHQLPEKPAQYTAVKWDGATKAWVPDYDLSLSIATGRRQKLLAASDYTQLPDVPLADKEEWAVYRQALRDITTQQGYPIDIIWPIAPGA